MNTLTEAEEARRGALLAEVLKLKRDKQYPDCWSIKWGGVSDRKTDLGLFRVVNRIVKDGE